MWILVAPPDQQHLHIPHCCGNVPDELRTILKQVTHMCPRNSHWPVLSKHTNKVLDRGQNFFLEKSQGVRLWQAVSWVCMICSSQPTRFLRQLRLGTFLRLMQTVFRNRSTGLQPILFRSPAKVGLLESLAFKATGYIGDFCCGQLQCRTSLPCNKNNPEITSLTCKRPLRERNEKKA